MFTSSYNLMRSYQLVSARWIALIVAISSSVAMADKFDDNDFLIAGELSGNIYIYDAIDFSPKGTLAGTGMSRVRGLAFDSAGNVLAVGLNNNLWRIDPNGVVVNLNDEVLGGPTDVVEGPTGTIFVSTQLNISEFDTNGNMLGTLGSGDYKSSAILPGGILWGGGGGSGGVPGLLNIFDLCGPMQIDSVSLDNGQEQVQKVFYSHSTATMLMADRVENALFERALDGTFLRRFDASFSAAGAVTRGPKGQVFATDFVAESVFRWEPDGTFLGSIALGGGIDGANDILWTGNSPTVGDPDIDGDGVHNHFDICPTVPAPGGVDADGRPLGDLDKDCDVDLSDFSILALNFTGS